MTFPDPDAGVLKAGLAWLYETVQPAGAIIQHHGVIHQSACGRRSYSFTSTGVNGLPVIVIDVAAWRRHPVTGEIGPRLEPGEMAANAAVITQLGGEIDGQWNGDGWISGSFGLATSAHPTLVAAVKRYFAHCPEHPNVICGWQAGVAGSEGAYCRWYDDGYAKIMQPSWPDA